MVLSKLHELHERIVELSSEPANLAEYERLRPQLAALDGLTAAPRTTAQLTQLIEALQAQQVLGALVGRWFGSSLTRARALAANARRVRRAAGGRC